MPEKPTEEIKPGDVVMFLGTPHLIDRIEAYDGPFDFIHGIARAADGWGISLETGATLTIA